MSLGQQWEQSKKQLEKSYHFHINNNNMRDKDSQLIFESYRKKVILNEVAQALAIPAVEGLGAAMSWIAGTAVGAVVINKAMQMLEQIPEFKRRQIEGKISEVNKIVSLNPQEIRSHYEIINAIQKNGNATLSKIAESFRQPIDIFRSAQDEGNVTVDTYIAVLASSIEAQKILLNAQDLIDRQIDEVISQSDLADVVKEQVKAQRAKDKLEHKERLAALENEKLKLEIELRKGGGGGGDKDPKGKGGIVAGVTGGISILGTILKILSENYKALKGIFWATIILVPGFGIFIIKTLFGSGKEYGKAGKEFADEVKKELESEKPKTPPQSQPQPSSTPTQGKFKPSRYVEEPSKTQPSAKASPTPYKADF
jgi:hypothetical protein